MTRKPRTDSKLRSLPSGHRAQVDRWLFDKGLSYQQVADACRDTFGLAISRSSVARYFQRETLAQIEQRQQAEHRVRQRREAALIARLSPEERYQMTLQLMAKRAFDALNRSEDPLNLKQVCQIARILIAARRERNEAMLAALHRKKFELWASAQVLDHYWQLQGSKKRPGRDELRRRILPTITWREQCGFTNSRPSRRRKPTTLEWDLAERNGFNTLHIPY